MAKAQRATDKLNVSLSGISAASSIINSLVSELPDSETKRQITTAAKQIGRGIDEAFAQLRAIKNAAESI